jgi:type I restriction enzyme S subunit
MAGEWKRVAVDEVCELIVDCVNKTAPVVEELTPYKMLRTTNVKGGRIDREECRRVSKETFFKWTRRADVRRGDVILTREAPLGEVGYVDFDDTVFLGQRLMQYRANPALLEPRFLLYSFLSNDLQNQFGAHEGSGSTVSHIRVGDCSKFQLSLPPLAEQKAIAEVLGGLDDKIELNRRMNAKLEEMARALFQSWFVDFDPVRAKRDGREPVGLDSNTAALFPQYLDNSTLGIIPKGWQVNRISEVVEEVFDGPHATPPHVEEGPIFLGIKNLTGSALALSDTRYISESDWPRWTKRVTPKPLDIVFSYEATLGFFALIPPGLRCCLGRRLALIRPRAEDGHSHFWFHQFIGPDFQRYLIQHSVQGATVDRIPLIQFPNYFVLNPPSALKEAFECRVAPLWAKIHTNAKQSRTLATLRDTLLPKLLCGELSVETTKN